MSEAPRAFREPNLALRLRWGSYPERYLGGILLIVAGQLVLIGSNTYTVPYLLAGTVATVAGWLILPAPGLRRLAVVFPCLVIVWVLLTGPQSLFLLGIPFLSWLWVRRRPLRSYAAVLIVIVAGILVAGPFNSSHGEPPAFAIAAVAFIAAAWLARALATTRRPSP